MLARELQAGAGFPKRVIASEAKQSSLNQQLDCFALKGSQ
jgi:hypothetical protein